MSKFRTTCDEATTICDKSQYGEATFFEKIKLNIHFLICKICGLYSKQNTEMSKMYKMKLKRCKKEYRCFSTQEKEDLKNKIKELKA
jgi:hypothetical protein